MYYRMREFLRQEWFREGIFRKRHGLQTLDVKTGAKSEKSQFLFCSQSSYSHVLPGLFSTKRTEYRLWCLEMWKAAIKIFPFFFLVTGKKDSKLEATPRWGKNDEE